VSDLRHLRVALDLSGPRDPLGNGMALLARTLQQQDAIEIIRFQSESEDVGEIDVALAGAHLWRGLWHRGRGRRIDALLPAVDVIHFAGLATAPTRQTPVVISVDDLRPLRDDAKDRQRVAQLKRAVKGGAQLVASSRAAMLEVQRSLSLSREQVVIVAPPVALSQQVPDGLDLVVNITGRTEQFLAISHALVALAQRREARVVVLASSEASQRISQSGEDVDVYSRRHAAQVLDRARAVVHLSDGARFPSFAIAALAAGVPTCATPTPVNRELLEGAAMIEDESNVERFVDAVQNLWENEPRRSVLRAAGRDRSLDYSPQRAATAYRALYEDLVRRQARA
jgi:glycosyltransferase involved in cell wall biosynthesis